MDRLQQRQDEIRSLSESGYTVVEMDRGFCFRVNRTYDVYPVRNKWHHLPSGKRGEVGNLKAFILKSLDLEKLAVAEENRKAHALSIVDVPDAGSVYDPEIISGKVCPYCKNATELVSSTRVYAKDYGLIYLCEPCNAWVGVHENTTIAKGRLANEELRKWKKDAHQVFDNIWQTKITLENCSKKKARDFAYRWLSQAMGLRFGQCHIGWMDVPDCQRVIHNCLAVPVGDVLAGSWQKDKDEETIIAEG